MVTTTPGSPRRARRGRAHRALAAPALVLTGAIALAGCGPDPGLRIENPQGVPSSTARPPAPAGPADEPFSADEIREALIADDTVTNMPDVEQVDEVLLVCTECIELAAPVVADGRKFQVAMVSTPSDDRTFAGVVVSQFEDRPRINLIVSGHDLTLSPGRGGTLVAQESMYREGDQECCPSGWSVRVFRYQDGSFEAGQRITQNDGA